MKKGSVEKIMNIMRKQKINEGVAMMGEETMMNEKEKKL